MARSVHDDIVELPGVADGDGGDVVHDDFLGEDDHVGGLEGVLRGCGSTLSAHIS